MFRLGGKGAAEGKFFWWFVNDTHMEKKKGFEKFSMQRCKESFALKRTLQRNRKATFKASCFEGRFAVALYGLR
jgi:formylmethanofuran dehydrogenase subunit E